MMIISSANKIASVQAKLPTTSWIGFLINQAAGHIRSSTAQALQSFGITPPHLRVLEAIAASEPIAQVRLGEMVNMDRSTMVHVVDRLESLGLADRKAVPTDRRSHAVMLTKKGRRVLTAARARALECQDDFLARLSSKERDLFVEMLGKLVNPTPCPQENDDDPCTSPANTG